MVYPLKVSGKTACRSRTLHVAQFLRYMRRERCNQCLVHFWRTGNDICPKSILVAAERADATAGLPYHERAGGRVPGLQSHLPESVDAAGGDISQIQGRRAGAANARGHRAQHAEHGKIVVRIAFVLAVGKAGRQQCALEPALLADTDAAILQMRAVAARGGEHLLAHRIVEAADLEPAALLDRDRHGEYRKAA